MSDQVETRTLKCNRTAEARVLRLIDFSHPAGPYHFQYLIGTTRLMTDTDIPMPHRRLNRILTYKCAEPLRNDDGIARRISRLLISIVLAARWAGLKRRAASPLARSRSQESVALQLSSRSFPTLCKLPARRNAVRHCCGAIFLEFESQVPLARHGRPVNSRRFERPLPRSL